MATRIRCSALGLVLGLLAGAGAAQSPAAAPPAASGLRSGEALLRLGYQGIRVPGDAPIDLLGLHVFGKLSDGLYLGAGVYAPHFEGDYGGFMAFDIGAHLRHRLGGAWFAAADLSAGGGGRSVAQSRVLGRAGAPAASSGLRPASNTTSARTRSAPARRG